MGCYLWNFRPYICLDMKTFHFISGLPRSGSTLLANLLGQNPAIHVTPTSACHESLFTIRNYWNGWIEHKAAKELGDSRHQRRVLRAILDSYHDTDKPIVIDKGRGWVSMLEMIEWVTGEKAKVLVPVRSITGILSSMERIWRKQSATGQTPNEQQNYIKMQTVAGRTDEWMQNSQVVGLAYTRLKDAIQRGFSDRLHFIEFDDLTKNPADTVDKIYNFLELPAFAHDFNNVEQITHEDDTVHGIQGLHDIAPKITSKPDDSISVLGREICKQYTGVEFWR